MFQVGNDAISLPNLCRQNLPFMTRVAQVLFENAHTGVAGTRNHTNNFRIGAPAHPVRINPQRDGQKNTSSERQPEEVPIRLCAPMAISVSDGKASLFLARRNTGFILSRPRTNYFW